MGNEKVILHFKYWIGILIFIIVLVISTIWGGLEGLGDKLSFAMTLSSLILALLAIYITFHYSNLSNDNIRLLVNANEKINISSDRIEKAAIKLKDEFEEVPKSISELGGKLENIEEILSEQGKVDNKYLKSIKLTKESEIVWDEMKFMNLFLNLPSTIMHYIYFFHLIHKNNKTINTVMIRKEYKAERVESILITTAAFLVSLGLIKIESEEEFYLFKNFKVVEINKNIGSIENIYQNVLDGFKESNPDFIRMKEGMEYFANNI